MGKFSDEIAEVLYEATLDSSQDETAGDVQDIGIWSALFRGVEVQDGELKDGFPGGYILQEDDQGFVDYTEFQTDEELQEAWDWILKQEEEYYKEEE